MRETMESGLQQCTRIYDAHCWKTNVTLFTRTFILSNYTCCFNRLKLTSWINHQGFSGIFFKPVAHPSEVQSTMSLGFPISSSQSPAHYTLFCTKSYTRSNGFVLFDLRIGFPAGGGFLRCREVEAGLRAPWRTFRSHIVQLAFQDPRLALFSGRSV